MSNIFDGKTYEELLPVKILVERPEQIEPAAEEVTEILGLLKTGCTDIEIRVSVIREIEFNERPYKASFTKAQIVNIRKQWHLKLAELKPVVKEDLKTVEA